MSNKEGWNRVSKWYDRLVGESGHYYHEKVILPRLKEFFKEKKSLLDVGCGQGILKTILSEEVEYVGIDSSKNLIEEARRKRGREFLVGDGKSFSLKKVDFEAAALILCLQDMEFGFDVIKNIKRHVKVGGELVIVLNHPCFRIPRQSSWEVDPKTKIQKRCLNLYMSSQKIPIFTEPSKGEKSEKVFYFHNSLSTISKWLFEAKFAIFEMEEWISDKVSQGGVASMENKARSEFPLFLCLKTIRL